MEDFLKMDIFFAATTAVVLLLGICFMIALVYSIRILRNIDHVAQNISQESDNVKGDLELLRKKIREEGMKVSHFLHFFTGMLGRRHRRSKKEPKK